MKAIAPDMTIKEAMDLYPATRSVFARHRLDTCCGGIHSIVTAAVAKGLDPDTLLSELRSAAHCA